MSKNLKDRLYRGNDELFVKGNIDFINEFFSTEYIVHAGGTDHKGHDFISKFIGQLRSAIPDIEVVKIGNLGRERGGHSPAVVFNQV